MAAPRRVALLGATGSIGRQALDIVDRSETLELVALAAGTACDELCRAAAERGVEHVALADPAAAADAEVRLGRRVGAGAAAVAHLAAEAGADIVLNAVVGVAGLDATLAALDAGIDVALANKESLVAGGPLVLAARAGSGAALVPVDSEHSALHQLLEAQRDPAAVDTLVITASGGPFRGRTLDDLQEVSIDDALAHPTWRMGAKITVDSATLMNKGLELIEASVLFGIPPERVEVVVHPQSIVHALVRLRDGALLAHLGLPDMRVPISYALHHPERPATPAGRLDLSSALSLTFEPPDVETFRCLQLAREACEAGGTAPCALNAANEEAVAAFLAGRCGFCDIAALVAGALDGIEASPLRDRAQLDAVDAAARASVRETLAGGSALRTLR
jgi:1-deoxy-D-xylulose-5-phosphate reductoisomerase